MMKALVSRAVLSLSLVLAFPAAAQWGVDLEETALPSSLASTVQTIFPQCWNCSMLDVHTFDVTYPEEGAIDHEEAGWAAIYQLGAYYYDPTSSISQATFDSRMANFWYEELPPAIRSSVAPGDTSWTASESWWGYMTAPDYCDYGHFYVLVFHDARKVVTVEINSGRDC